MTAASPPRGALCEMLGRDLARGTSSLPTLPHNVMAALRLARTPTLDFDEIGRVAEKDPPLAARVISIANSALYARTGAPRIVSVRRAAVRLGTQATRDVLFQVAYATMFVDAPRFLDLIDTTFQHGVRTARAARVLARERRFDMDVAFLCGLLHDVGSARCWRLLSTKRAPFDMEEAGRAVDLLHARAGAELASAWRLPNEVVESCRFHHDPRDREYPLFVAGADAVANLHDGTGDAEETRGRVRDAGVPTDQVDRVAAQMLAAIAAPEQEEQ